MADNADTAKKQEPPKPIVWSIYKLAAKAVRLCEVEATIDLAESFVELP